jgi:hypothetical protein
MLVALALPRPALADILALEPGKRIKGHQSLDCNQCHTSGSGISRDKCLNCHEHKPLARRIRANEGLHARPDFKQTCSACHLEHKGVNHDPIDWRPFGGVKRFNHDLAGYKLEGAHQRQSCTACHTAKHKESGRTKYLGLDSNCLSCHEDVHRFAGTRRDLMECRTCHAFDARTVTRAKGLDFDHGKVSKFPLYGKHDETRCSNCHTSTTIFKMKDKPERCADCHKDEHKNVYTAKGRDCKECHSDRKKAFTTGDFDHGKATSFPLRFKHAKQKCTQCHEKKALEPPRLACASCHQKDSVHVIAGENRFAGRDCGQCHQDKGFNAPLTFNHARSASFALGGKHAKVSCTDCHRKKPKAQIKTAVDSFERFGSSSCIGCHAHGNQHDGKFNDRPQLCTKCHVPGSTNIKNPEHSELSAVFDQQGAHSKVSCEKCHGQGLVKLKVGDDCSACHAKDDHHQGNLGTTCKQCHFEGFPWSDVLFDHNTQASFTLDGKHQAVSCSSCHTSAPKTFKPTQTSCVSCHAQQDKHAGALGTDCAKCHDTSGRAPLFDHNTMTNFPLQGAHTRADCRGCHFQQELAAKERRFELDLRFTAVGTHCADCHGDPHGLRPGASCLGCHDQDSFLDAAGRPGGGDTDGPLKSKVPSPDAGPNGRAVFEGADHGKERRAGGVVVTLATSRRDEFHDIPPFALRGGHSRLECHTCHGERGDLSGFGNLCDTCHRQDDIHAGGLGPSCADCHSLRAFMPASFSHTQVGFSLVGAHRMASCKQCHAAGNYMGMSGDCVSCHLDDAIRAERITGTPHGGFLQQPCINCHNQVSWTLSPFLRRRF